VLLGGTRTRASQRGKALADFILSHEGQRIFRAAEYLLPADPAWPALDAVARAGMRVNSRQALLLVTPDQTEYNNAGV